MEWMHSHALVHLDIAGRNCLVNHESHKVTFIDFELASFVPRNPLKRRFWKPSPIAEGAWPEDSFASNFDPFAADVWSVGTLFQEELKDRVRVASSDPLGAASDVASLGTDQQLARIR